MTGLFVRRSVLRSYLSTGISAQAAFEAACLGYPGVKRPDKTIVRTHWAKANRQALRAENTITNINVIHRERREALEKLKSKK